MYLTDAIIKKYSHIKSRSILYVMGMMDARDFYAQYCEDCTHGEGCGIRKAYRDTVSNETEYDFGCTKFYPSNNSGLNKPEDYISVGS